MGVCNPPYIFQEEMNKLFQVFKYVRAYLDDILVLNTGDWDDNVTNLE